jgi:hypothetical protein
MTTSFLDREVELPDKFRDSLRHAVDRQRDASSLAEHLRKLYADLSQCRDFTALLAAARRFTPGAQSPVFHASLVEDHQCRLSLVGIHRFAPIPVHDHPHMTGVQLVVHGRVRVRNYRVSAVVRDPSLVKLECVADLTLGAGATATIENGANNLHGMEALNLTAVCLALQTPPVAAERQAWYFPTYPLADHHEHMTWNRIVKPPRQSRSSRNHCASLAAGGALPC